MHIWEFNKRNHVFDKSTWTKDERDLNLLDFSFRVASKFQGQVELIWLKSPELYKIPLENIAKQINFCILKYSLTKEKLLQKERK